MKGKISFNERQEKEYLLIDSDVSDLFDTLLKYKLIQLHEMKRPKEADKINDPNFCVYHCLISHLVEKCFVLKDKIIDLYNEIKIEFEDDMAASNMVSIELVSVLSCMIKFDSLEPIFLGSSVQKNECPQ